MNDDPNTHTHLGGLSTVDLVSGAKLTVAVAPLHEHAPTVIQQTEVAQSQRALHHLAAPQVKGRGAEGEEEEEGEYNRFVIRLLLLDNDPFI